MNRAAAPRSMRWRLLGRIAVVLIGTMAAIAAGSYLFVFRVERRIWEARQREAGRRAVVAVESFLDRAHDALALIGLLDAEELRKHPEVLRKFIALNPAVRELLRVDERGTVIGSACQDRAVIGELLAITRSSWFVRARAGEDFIGELEISALNEPYLVLARPAADGTIVALRIRMNFLWDVVQGHGFGRTGVTYIVNRSGRVIAHPDPQVALSRASLSGRPEFAGALAAAPGEWWGDHESMRGVRVQTVAMPVRKTPWIVMAEIPLREVREATRAALLVLDGGVLLFGLIAMALTGAQLSSLVFRPLEALRDGVGRIGRGDLAHRIPILSDDEVGESAVAINEMAGRLSDRDQELARQKQQLEKAITEWCVTIDSMGDLIFLLDDQGTVVKANRRAAAFCGHDFRALPGTPLLWLFAPEDLPGILGPLARMHTTRQPVDAEWRMRRTGRRYLITIEPIHDGHAAWNGAVLVVRDVTELKVAEEDRQLLNQQLQQARKMESIGRLASGIAHDFNNILLATIGFSDAALEKLPAGHPAREDLETIIGAGERGATLVRQLLAFGRQQDLNIRPLELAAVLGDFANIAARVLPKQISVVVRTAPELPRVNADPVQLEQVLFNLSTNARDAMPEGGILTLEGERTAVEETDVWLGVPAGAFVLLRVRDTGEGMTREVQEMIFEPFFTSKEEGKGTGLGLATVYGIIAQHGGAIRVESEPGRGTEFSIFLPVAPEASSILSGAAAGDGPGPKR